MSNYDEPPRADEMDIIGSLFGIRFVEGGTNGLAELYIEDDGWYHLKCTFAVFWLADLKRTVEKACQEQRTRESGVKVNE